MIYKVEYSFNDRRGIYYVDITPRNALNQDDIYRSVVYELARFLNKTQTDVLKIESISPINIQ